MALPEDEAKKKEVAKKVIFSASIDGKVIKVKVQNISKFSINYYEVDPEVTFS